MPNVLQQIRGSWRMPRVTMRATLAWAVVMVLVAGVAAAFGLSGAASPEPELVARVNGEPVTRDELQRILADPLVRRQLQQELGGHQADSRKIGALALRTLVHRRLLLQEAARRNIKVTREDLSSATVALRARFKDLKEFGEWLKARGLHDETLQALLRDDLLMTRARAALVEGVQVTDAEVQAYYEKHKDKMKAPDTVHLRLIAVKDRAAAEEIRTAVEKGGDFARLAEERSLVGADKAGDMGWVDPSRLVTPLREAVPTLKVGQTSEPLEHGEQVLLARLEERRPAHAMDLAEARPGIERHLLAAKQQEVVQAWLRDQGKKSTIEVFSRPNAATTGAMSGQAPITD